MVAQIIIAILVLWLPLKGGAAPARVSAVPGLKPGYLDSIEDEKTDLIDDDIVVIREPPAQVSQKPFLSDKLSKEFEAQYYIRFGRTEAERNLLPSRYDTYFYNGLMVDYNEDLRRKQAFGNFMVRRLEEYHLDNAMRGNQTFRPAYEAKEKISKVKVKLSNDFNVRMNTSISGYFVDMYLDNPWRVQQKSTFYLNSKELISSIGFKVTDRVSVLTDYRIQSSVVRLILSRQITPALSANISGTTYVSGSEGEGSVDGFIRQHLVLMGFTFRN